MRGEKGYLFDPDPDSDPDSDFPAGFFPVPDTFSLALLVKRESGTKTYLSPYRQSPFTVPQVASSVPALLPSGA